MRELTDRPARVSIKARYAVRGVDMQVHRMAVPLGAVVSDIDVREMSDGAWQDINALFLEHHVLAFPGQRLTPAEQMAFASRWGELVRHPYNGLPEHRAIW